MFGGFIRDLLKNKIPRDVDIWFNYPDQGAISVELWQQIVMSIVHSLKDHIVSDLRAHPMNDDRNEISTVKIDGIDFDFCRNINGRVSFTTVCDFTVNNLYIWTDGEIRTRVNTKYSVHDILNHIKDWTIIDINDIEITKRYLKPPTYDLKYYMDKTAKKAERLRTFLD